MESTKGESFGEMFELLMTVTSQLAEHRRELCRIIVDDDEEWENADHDDGGETRHSEQIRQMKKSILKYRSRGLASEIEERPEMKSVFSQMTPSIEMATEMMRKLAKPIEDHSRLLDSIAAVIKGKLPDDEKIEAITDLLL